MSANTHSMGVTKLTSVVDGQSGNKPASVSTTCAGAMFWSGRVSNLRWNSSTWALPVTRQIIRPSRSKIHETESTGVVKPLVFPGHSKETMRISQKIDTGPVSVGFLMTASMALRTPNVRLAVAPCLATWYAFGAPSARSSLFNSRNPFRSTPRLCPEEMSAVSLS